MSQESLAERRTEFDSHVWNHSEDSFQTAFDLRPQLDEGEIEGVRALVSGMQNLLPDNQIAEILLLEINRRPQFLLLILQLVGLTREKPRSDLKPVLAALGIKSPSKISKYPERAEVWRYLGPYLVARIRTVLGNFVSLTDEALPSALEAVNQATWPGYVRQERAKRSGGYAEQRVAIVLKALGIPFVPLQKAENGLTKDVQYAGQSFDLLVPDATSPRLCIMSMAHSANIGQYGESKADDVRRASEALRRVRQELLLGVFADGVGFDSNRAGLESILTNADEVFQFATLWKVAVTAASVLKLRLNMVIQDQEHHAKFLERHQHAVVMHKSLTPSFKWVEAGEGWVSRI